MERQPKSSTRTRHRTRRRQANTSTRGRKDIDRFFGEIQKAADRGHFSPRKAFQLYGYARRDY